MSEPAIGSINLVALLDEEGLDERYERAVELLVRLRSGGNHLSFETGCPECGIADVQPVVWDGARAVHAACLKRSG